MRSLRARLSLSFTALLAAGLAGFGVIVWLLSREALIGDVDEFLRGKAMLLARFMPSSRVAIEPWMEQDLQVHERQFYLQVFRADGTLAGKSSNLAAPIPLTADAKRSEHPAGGVVLETVQVAGRPVRLATHPRRERWGDPVVLYAQAAMPLDAWHARQLRLLAWLVGCGTILLGSGAVAAWYLSRLWLRSVATLEETARDLSAGDLSRRRLFAPSDDAELAALARTFNNLLDRLESLHATQQRFTADASHELRTPLTILRGEIEVALRKPRSAEEYREVLLSGKEEIERLSRLTENMLALTRADAGDALSARERVRLGELCAGMIAKLQPLAEEKEIALTLESDAAAPEVDGDPVALERILQNLLENALRYSPRGERVRVHLSRDGADARIVVSDTGRGIAPEHLPHVFERFYRVDRARSRAHGGSGLGLSIVKALVEAHGGTVSVESVVGAGTSFIVRLPAAP